MKPCRNCSYAFKCWNNNSNYCYKDKELIKDKPLDRQCSISEKDYYNSIVKTSQFK